MKCQRNPQKGSQNKFTAKGISKLTVLVCLCLGSLSYVYGTEPGEPIVAPIEISQPSGIRSEAVSSRDRNTRVWTITREIEEFDPVTEQTKLVKIPSRVIEKGCGICYQDESGWQVTDTSWQTTESGFVMDKANYKLQMGVTAGQVLHYIIDGQQLDLRASKLAISDGANSQIMAQINGSVEGHIDPNLPNILVFQNAFGPGIDLQLEANVDGFHQNVIFRQKPVIPAGFNVETSAVKLFTEIDIDTYTRNTPEGVDIALEAGGDQEHAPVYFDDPLAIVSTQPSKAEIRFVIKRQGVEPLISHRFVDSAILQTKQANGKTFHEPAAIADKQLLRDETTNKVYLVESLGASIFENSSYPVIWDYHDRYGTLNEDERWYADATYYISDNLTLDTDVKLEIEPGTIVKFNTYKQLDARNGRLIAKGRPYEYILFTSKDDDTCGETISGSDGSPTMGDWLQLNVGDNSVIQFCKISYAMVCIMVNGDTETIENNILMNSAYGVNINSAENDVEIRNNLMANVSTGVATTQPYLLINNTIDMCNIGLSECSGYGGELYNNLFTNCCYGVLKTTGTIPPADYNGFYNATDPYYGMENGTHDVTTTVSPYETDPCYLGNYFLNDEDNGGDLLVDAGAWPITNAASGYGDPSQWSIYHVPAGHMFTSTTSLSTDTTWQPDDSTCDTGTVAIGYHHPRVDYYVRAAVTATVTLTIDPNTVIAIENGSVTIGTNGTLLAEGSPVGGGYIKFMNAKMAKSKWSSVKYKQGNASQGYLYLTGASDDSKISFCDFVNLYNGIQVYGCSPTIHSNVFRLNYVGVSSNSYGTIMVENGLFSENQYGINSSSFLCTFYAYNSTFERNTKAGICGSMYNGTFNVENCLFVDHKADDYNPNDLSTAAAGIFSDDNPVFSYTYWNENNNLFYNNDVHHLWLEGSTYSDYELDGTDYAGQPTDENCGTENEYPLYEGWTDFADRFYIKQTSNAIDNGTNPDGMLAYTTAVDGAEDINNRDIGYHYPVVIRNPWEEITGTYDISQLLPGVTVTIYNQAGQGQPGFAVLPLVNLSSGYEVNYHEFSVTFSGDGVCKVSLGHSSVNDYDDIDGAASQSKYYLHTTPMQISSGQVVKIVSPYKNEHYSWLFIYTEGNVDISSVEYTYLKGTGTLHGHTARVYNFAEHNLPYRIMYPKNYDFTKKYPLVISVSGNDGDGSDNYSNMTLTILAKFLFTKYLDDEELECISIVPQIPLYNDPQIPAPYYPAGTQGEPTPEHSEDWNAAVNENGWYNQACLALIHDLIDNCVINVDPDRIYFTGNSYGGKACWEFLKSDAALFAGALCSAGWPIGGAYPLPPELADLADELTLEVERYKQVPVWIFDGGLDLMRFGSRAAYDEITFQGGTSSDYTEFPGVTHNNTGVYAFNNPDHIHWLFQQSLSNRPALELIIRAYAETGTYISPCETIRVTGGCDTVITPGQDQTFTISADSGIDTEFFVDGEFQGFNLPSYTFYNVTTRHKIEVKCFERTIHASAENDASIDPSGDTIISNLHTDRTYTIVAPVGRTAELFIDGVWQSVLPEGTSYYTFYDIEEDHEIVVQTIDALIGTQEYRTIQDAIDAALTDDVVEVLPGSYETDIDFNGKAITVQSSDPDDPDVVADTILQGDSMIRFVNYEENSSVFSGFTIQNEYYGVFCQDSSPTISNCVIKPTFSGRDGIRCYFGAPHITNNTICIDEVSEGSSGIYVFQSSPVIRNNLISGSRIDYFGDGAGIYLFEPGQETEISNNTIVDNDCGISSYGASGLQIMNCIIWDSDYAFVTESGTLSVTYSCIQDWTEGGTGNISSDPLFIEQDNLYHITSNSPCKDTGAPGSYTGQADLDGQDRVYNSTVDMGADEYWP